MTAVHFDDLTIRSPNRFFELEARSPDNGSIQGPPGHIPRATDVLRAMGYQRSFRYRLKDLRTGRLMWERWQQPDENSPTSLHVSNDGRCVVHTHGRFADQLIILGQWGDRTLKLEVTSEKYRDNFREMEKARVIVDPRIRESSAGPSWAVHSRAYFFEYEGRPHFCMRAWWGMRIVLDLNSPDHVKSIPSKMQRVITQFETAWARRTLSFLGGDPGWWTRPKDETSAIIDPEGNELELHNQSEAITAMLIAYEYKLDDALDSVAQLESCDSQSSSIFCREFLPLPSQEKPWATASVTLLSVRVTAQWVMRSMGRQPRGLPGWFFERFDEDQAEDPDLQVGAIRNRKRPADADANVDRLRVGMDGQRVLELVGSPDLITRKRVEAADRVQICWVYDFGVGENVSRVELLWYADEIAKLRAVRRREMGKPIDVVRRVDQIGF